MKSTAKPRKEADPTASVTMVMKIEDDCVGSRPSAPGA